MADLSEVWKAIGDALSGDSTLTDMLGDDGQIFFGKEITAQINAPAIRFWVIDDGPVKEASLSGYFQPRVQIDILATSMTAAEAIKQRIDTLLEIPRRNAASLTLATYDLKSMTRLRAMHIGATGLTQDGRKVQHYATEWTLKVTE